MTKRATTSGSNAAIIIGVIAVALILYIIFLPQAEREKILKEGGIEPKTGLASGFLLQKHVGRLVYDAKDAITHYIPSFHLFESAESQILAKYTPFTIKRGWFTDQAKQLSFSFDDFEHTENIFLVFSAPRHEGVLKIWINSELIYEYEIKTATVKPIQLDKSMLKPRNNILELEAGSTGLRFWDVNVYSIEDLQVVGDITDVTRQASQNLFAVDAAEFDSLVSARLSFLPECDTRTVGTLNIKINNQLIYSAIPDCGSINIQDVDTTALAEGKNSILFSTKQGDFRLNDIKLVSKLKSVKSVVEYFEVDEELYDDVQDNSSDVILEMDFVDDGKRKAGRVNVNGHFASFDQSKPLYSKNINNWVVLGAKNYVEIVPETTLEIPEVRVKVK